MLAAICLTRRSDFIHEGEGKMYQGVFSAWMIRLEPHRVSGCNRAKRYARWSLHHPRADSITIE
jgi:hypothetical protein